MSERELKDKVALVTGASRGIGSATAIALAETGMSVALVGRNESLLTEVAKQCEQAGGKALVIASDVSDPKGLKAIVDNTVSKFGDLHVLVNNAGVYARSTVGEGNLSDWDRIFDVNVRALMHLTEHAVPHLKKHGWGAIINIASVAGKNSYPTMGAYCASKHAVVGFGGSLFEDVRQSGVKVSTICPGFVNTDMVRGIGLREEIMIQPEDIAKTVLYVLRFPKTGCPTEIIIRPQLEPEEN